MQSEFDVVSWTLDQLLQEFLNRVAEHGWFLAVGHAMTVELDKQPLGTALNRDSCLSPKAQSAHRGRVYSGNFAVLDAGKIATAIRPAQVDQKRPLDDQWERLRRTAGTEVVAPPVGRSLVLLICAEVGAGSVKSA
jgi:hypothetical protein